MIRITDNKCHSIEVKYGNKLQKGKKMVRFQKRREYQENLTSNFMYIASKLERAHLQRLARRQKR